MLIAFSQLCITILICDLYNVQVMNICLRYMLYFFYNISVTVQSFFHMFPADVIIFASACNSHISPQKPMKSRVSFLAFCLETASGILFSPRPQTNTITCLNPTELLSDHFYLLFPLTTDGTNSYKNTITSSILRYSLFLF